MTVCIAAFADDNKHLALVCDSKVAFGEFSADAAVIKNVPLIGEYAVLCAGNDVARANNIYNRVRKTLAHQDPSVDEIANALFEECKNERDRVVDAKVLRKHGYDTTTFREREKQLCTAAVFFDIHSAMAQVSLSLDFILAGFDGDGAPHIRFINYDTPPEDYDTFGFYAIGTGAHAALASLAHAIDKLSLSRWDNIGTVMYHAMAAKFMAESARDVGKDTFAVLLGHDEKPKFFNVYGATDYVRDRWEQEGSPRMPSDVDDAIADLLNHADMHDDEETLEKVGKHCTRAKSVLDARRHTQRKLPKSSASEKTSPGK